MFGIDKRRPPEVADPDQPQIFFEDVNERQGVFHRRTFLFGGLASLGVAVLGGRLAQLQLVDTARYAALSEGNQFNFRLQPPPRGLVLDRNGVALASNRPDFRLLIERGAVTDLDATLARVAQLVPMSPARLEQAKRDILRAPKGQPVQVAEDLTWEEFSRVNIRAPELPGVTADMGEVRVYPFGGAFAHVLGYVAKVSDRDLRAEGPNPEPLLLHPGFRIGKQGVEKAVDLQLRGRPGAEKVEVDARGRVVGKDPRGDVPSTPGQPVVLSLDADVQNRALEVFGQESGAAVVMDCRTGDLLCMMSAPAFDANRFVRGLSGPEYRALADYERKPLLDKVMTGLYPPGSTFKPTVALAALSAGIDPEARVVCGGGWTWGGRTWRCWGRHGSQNMHEAIKNSCDIYFYQTGLKIGPDRIAAAADAMGFGHTFDIGIPGQKKGLVPTTGWKRERFRRNPANQKWFPGETPSYAIGQGYLQVNALQLAVMTARLANGRKALHPRLIRSIGGRELPRGDAAPDLPFPAEHLEYVRDGMRAVANDTSGTAYRQSQLGLGDIKMAGKTGTAQVREFKAGQSRKSDHVTWRLKDHNLYVAFAPIDQPRYALSVLIEHGGKGGGTAAAPRAREIMRTVLLKDAELMARIQSPEPLPDAPPVDEGAAPEDPGQVQAAAPAAAAGRGRPA